MVAVMEYMQGGNRRVQGASRLFREIEHHARISSLVHDLYGPGSRFQAMVILHRPIFVERRDCVRSRSTRP